MLDKDILSNNRDILMMGKHGEQEFQNFLETLNCYHPTIKFRAENSRAKINFLDVTVMTCY